MTKNNLIAFMILLTAGGAFASGSTSRSRRSTPSRSRTTTKKFKPQASKQLSPEQKSIYESTSFYVQAKSNAGKFQVKDAAADNQAWSLTSVAGTPVYTDIGKTRRKVLRQFEGNLGSASKKHKVGVEFFLKGMGQRWKVERVKIASVNGNPR